MSSLPRGRSARTLCTTQREPTQTNRPINERTKDTYKKQTSKQARAVNRVKFTPGTFRQSTLYYATEANKNKQAYQQTNEKNTYKQQTSKQARAAHCKFYPGYSPPEHFVLRNGNQQKQTSISTNERKKHTNNKQANKQER